MHRDIKGGNILLTKDGVIKLADFGLARQFNKEYNNQFTVMVVTRWYRAPELLLGNHNYNELIDVWSMGCLIVEMLIGKPLFPGRSELEQIALIYGMFGVPNEESYPEARYLKFFNESVRTYKQMQQSAASSSSHTISQFDKLNFKQFL